MMRVTGMQLALGYGETLRWFGPMDDADKRA